MMPAPVSKHFLESSNEWRSCESYLSCLTAQTHILAGDYVQAPPS